ncbi:uncharacterized protein TM35_000021760 [Trypanosoma theileri]|uniref:Uncharacterized protein n=1 Tax=Trypanosoma theileri TaxID=67003 RepID=A0A1X0P8S7_9TRYP|nr:uncharacterized protein TM35_000021760 [Trypanosoma theileri]ORC92850.1 hypothetical protein TM35_000021760 [Trypanosoma theileri]
MSYPMHDRPWKTDDANPPTTTTTTHNILTTPDLLAQQRRQRAASVAEHLPYYYDVELEWVPTAVLRRTAYRMYPRMRSAVQWMESYGQQLVGWFGLDERGYEDERERRREQYYAELQRMYRKEAEKDDELCEARTMEMILSREQEGEEDDVESRMRTSDEVKILNRMLNDMEKDMNMDKNSVCGIKNNNNNSNDNILKEKLDSKTGGVMRKFVCMNIPSGFPIDELPEEVVC